MGPVQPILTEPSEPTRADGRDLRLVLIELAKRKTEGLRLYQPMPIQDEFHKSQAHERIIRGSNRGGKTVAACVEVARAATGQDPHDHYPKENGICYVVAKDERAIGTILWKKLGRAGAFKMIRDEITGEWRSFNLARPEDAARRKDAKPAPPLIPPRMIESITWLSKKSGVPKIVKMRNGWEIHFFTSNARPPHGVDIDLALFDEEILGQAWYPEIAARLVDRHGWFLWSATPQAGTDQLYALHERAEAQADLPKHERSIEEFVIFIKDNIHLSQQQKDEFSEKLSEAEREVRVEGEFAYVSYRVFPEWSENLHGIPWMEIPDNWTRYVAIDPGYQTCAALFGAVPSPEDRRHKDDVYLYDELYIHKCDAMKFGFAMKEKLVGQTVRAFIIDNHDARKSLHSDGKTIGEHYTAALRHYGVKSEVTGFGFAAGDDNPKAGVEAFRQIMRKRMDASLPLKVLRDRCVNFRKEIKGYRNKVVAVNGREIVTEIPQDKGPVHLMACARYLVQYGLYWHPRRELASPVGGVYEAHLAMQAKYGKPRGSGIMLGPGS